MYRKMKPWLLTVAILAVPGCGAVREMIVDAAQSTAKEALDEVVDKTVDELADEFLDFESFFDDEEPLEP